MVSSWFHHGLRHGAWRPSSAAGGQPSQGLVCRCDHNPIEAEVALLLALPLRPCLHAPAMRMNEVVAVVHDNARATRHLEGRPTSAAALTPLAHHSPIQWPIHRSIGLSIGLSAYRSAGEPTGISTTGISTTGISPGAPPLLLPAAVSAEDARILRRADAPMQPTTTATGVARTQGLGKPFRQCACRHPRACSHPFGNRPHSMPRDPRPVGPGCLKLPR